MKTSKVEISQQDLEIMLDEQLSFLEASSRSYDSGFEAEVKRLAVTVRVLVHDTQKSTSLLTLLSRKNIDFVDQSVPFDEANLQSHSSLVQMSLSDIGVKILPILDGGPFQRKISFDMWWNGLVFVDSLRNEFSRKDIVLSLANKEGGAHVDNKVDENYINLRKNNSLGWQSVSGDGVESPGPDQVPASMRQIAHEVLKTLRGNYNCTANTSDAGILVLSTGVFQGHHAPTFPEFNLPKNRPIVAGKKFPEMTRALVAVVKSTRSVACVSFQTL